MRNVLTLSLLLGCLVWVGCRGTEFEQPPVHLNLDMDFQPRYDPQERNPFFADNRSMRPPVPGTVARGFLREDTRFYLGRTEEGTFIEEIPIPVSRQLLERGQERYNIYCTPCHGAAGYGNGIIMRGEYGYTPAPSYHQERLREESDGYLYHVIANGVRNMPSYGHQVAVADRWAIVAYIRALQRSQFAPAEDVPASMLGRLEDKSAGTPDAAADTTSADTTAGDTTGTTP